MNILRDLSYLFSGNIIVQVIAFLIMPFVTRLYSPNELGIYQYMTTLALIFSPFVGFSFDQIIVKETMHSNVARLFSSAILIAISSAAVNLVAIYFYNVGFQTDIILEIEHYIFIYFILIFGVIFSCMQSIFLRDGSYSSYSKNNIFFSLVSNLIKVLLGTERSDSISLALSLIVGYLVSFIYSARAVVNHCFCFVSFRYAFRQLVMNKEFTLHLTISRFIGIFANWHIVLVAPLFASAGEVGLLSLAIMITKTPSQPFLISLANYAYSKCSSFRNNNDFLFFLFKLSLLGFTGLILAFIIVFFYGSEIIIVIFGNEWSNSSELALLFMFSLISAFTCYPVYFSLSNIYKKQYVILRVDIISIPSYIILVLYSVYVNLGLYDFIYYNSIVIFLVHIIKLISIIISIMKISFEDSEQSNKT